MGARRIAKFVWVCGVMVCAGTSGAVQACPAWDRAQDAYLNDDPAAARIAVAESVEDNRCHRLDRTQISRWAALAVRAETMAVEVAPKRVEAGLRRAEDLAATWSISAALGDHALARRAYTEAALHYQRALLDAEELNDPASELVDPAPDLVTHARIRRQAEEARLLAPKFVSLPGRPACRIRALGGLKVKTATPIWFETNSTDFTEEGAKAADELFHCLANLARADVLSVRIEGHADQRGDEQYNLNLSRERAKTVKTYLEGRKLAFPLVFEGYGETVPFESDNASAYTKAERYQLDRRVVVDVELARSR